MQPSASSSRPRSGPPTAATSTGPHTKPLGLRSYEAFDIPKARKSEAASFLKKPLDRHAFEQWHPVSIEPLPETFVAPLPSPPTVRRILESVTAQIKRHGYTLQQRLPASKREAVVSRRELHQAEFDLIMLGLGYSPAPVRQPAAEVTLTREEFHGEVTRKDITDNVRWIKKTLRVPPEGYTPPGMTCALYGHQLHASHWMAKVEELRRTGGGILADEMGLGKTISMLAVCVRDVRAPGSGGGTLIICPAGIINQWVDEIETRTCPPWRIHAYSGSQKVSSAAELSRFDFVLASYQTVVTEWPKENGPLFAVAWHRIVLDEAHHIAKFKIKTAKAVRALHATHRWCLTGTPLQNNLWDFFSYCMFIGIPGWSDEAYMQENVISRKDAPYAMATVLAKFLLRRTKGTLLDGKPILAIVPKVIEDVPLEFAPEERDLYEGLRLGALGHLNHFLGQKEGFGHILAQMTRLMITCNHAELVFRTGDKAALKAAQAVLRLWDERSLAQAVENLKVPDGCLCTDCQEFDDDLLVPPCGHAICAGCYDTRDWDSLDPGAALRCRAPGCIASVRDRTVPVAVVLPAEEHAGAPGGAISTKFQAVLTRVAEWRVAAPNDKVIVISRFVGTLEWLREAFIGAGYNPASLFSYNGSVLPPARRKIEQAYTAYEGHAIMFLSIKAGGLGLNLVAANRVVLVEPHPNPSVEAQAMDRAHRIGQKKTVYVARLYISDSIEERIREIQERKVALANASLGGEKDDAGGGAMNVNQVKQLLQWTAPPPASAGPSSGTPRPPKRKAPSGPSSQAKLRRAA